MIRPRIGLSLDFHRSHVSTLMVVLASVLIPGLGRARADDQPQWGERYTRNMVSAEKGLPEAIQPGESGNLKWKVPLGTETYATPIIAGGRIYIGSNNAQPRNPTHKGDRSILYCLDERDGSFLWQLVVPKVTNSMFWDWPRAGICSPVTVDEDRVYLVSNRGEVLCMDPKGMADGNQGSYTNEATHAVPQGTDPVPMTAQDADILWLYDMIGELKIRQHDQAHSSILVYGDYLYVNTSNGVDDSHKRIDSPDAPSLVVLDKRTGRLVAKDAEHIGPRIFHSTWSSPAMAVIDGKPTIVFCGGDGILYGFEPVTASPPPGEVLALKKRWSFDCDPTAPKEAVHKYNSNRRVSPSNIKSMPVFYDGRLYITAGGDVWWGKNEAYIYCVNPRGSGDLTKSGLVWSYPLERHCMTTPAVYNGMVFAGDSGGKIHCVDARTGKGLWTHDAGGEMWSSAYVADGKVYAGTRGGDLHVLAADKEKRVLSTARLDGPIHGTPIAANGVLYLTTMKWLYAFHGIVKP